MLRAAVGACDFAVFDLETKLRRDNGSVALAFQCARQQLFIRVRPVDFRRVKEVDAEFERAMNRRNRFALVAVFGYAIREAHPHAAKTDG